MGDTRSKRADPLGASIASPAPRVEPLPARYRRSAPAGPVDTARPGRPSTGRGRRDGERAERSAPAADVPAAFRGWVETLRGELEETRRAWDAEEAYQRAATADVPQRPRGEAPHDAATEAITAALVRRLEGARQELRLRVMDLSDREHAAHRACFREALLPMYLHAATFRQAYQRAIGAPGDYDGLRRVHDQQVQGATAFERAFDRYALHHESVIRALHNRAAYLRSALAGAASVCPRDRVRIASVGCGPAREVAALLETSPEIGARIDFTLIDSDVRVLACCDRALRPLADACGAQLHLVRGAPHPLDDPHRLRNALGAQDLVYSAGAFDYCDDAGFRALSALLYSCVLPGGQLVIGNLSIDNPSRWLMDYIADWRVYHRCPSYLRALGLGLRPQPASLAVQSEPLGVGLFLVAHR